MGVDLGVSVFYYIFLYKQYSHLRDKCVAVWAPFFTYISIYWHGANVSADLAART